MRVLCRPDLAPGFALAGVSVDAADESSAGVAMARLASDPTVGVVLVEERLQRTLSTELLQRLDRRGVPVVVAFPSPSWGGRTAAEAYVLALLRQAVGYRVRPR